VIRVIRRQKNSGFAHRFNSSDSLAQSQPPPCGRPALPLFCQVSRLMCGIVGYTSEKTNAVPILPRRAGGGLEYRRLRTAPGLAVLNGERALRSGAKARRAHRQPSRRCSRSRRSMGSRRSFATRRWATHRRAVSDGPTAATRISIKSGRLAIRPQWRHRKLLRHAGAISSCARAHNPFHSPDRQPRCLAAHLVGKALRGRDGGAHHQGRRLLTAPAQGVYARSSGRTASCSCTSDSAGSAHRRAGAAAPLPCSASARARIFSSSPAT